LILRYIDPDYKALHDNQDIVRKIFAGEPLDEKEKVIAKKMQESGISFGETAEKQKLLGEEYKQLGMVGIKSEATGFDPETQGRYFQKASQAYTRGGLGELASYADVGINQEILKDYVGEVKKATEAFASLSASAENLQEQHVQYNAAVEGVTKKILSIPGMQPIALSNALQGEADVVSSTSPKIAQIMRNRAENIVSKAAAGEYDAQIIAANQAAGTRFPVSQGSGGSWGMMKSPGARLLYGAYMARRMWQYTAAPFIQEAQQYGMADYNPLAYQGEWDQLDYPRTAGGAAYRAAVGSSWKSRGAYATLGGFTDLPYAMSGLPLGVSQAASGIGLGAGIAAGGVEIAMPLHFMKDVAPSLAKLAGPLATGAMIAGGAIAGYSIVGGAYDILRGNEDPTQSYTIGNVPRRRIMGYLRTTGLSYAMRKAEYATQTGKWDGQVSEYDALKSVFGESAADYLLPEPMSEEETKSRQMARHVAMRIGAEPEQMIPLITQLSASLPGDRFGYEQLYKDFYSAGMNIGISPDQYQNMLGSFASQLGYLPGSQQYLNLTEHMTGINSQAQIETFGRDLSKQAMFAGQLSPYMTTDASMSLVRNYDSLMTQSGVGNLASFLNMYESYGGKLEKEYEKTEKPIGAFAGTIPEYEPRSMEEDASSKKHFDVSQVIVDKIFPHVPSLKYGSRIVKTVAEKAGLSEELSSISQTFSNEFQGLFDDIAKDNPVVNFGLKFGSFITGAGNTRQDGTPIENEPIEGQYSYASRYRPATGAQPTAIAERFSNIIESSSDPRLTDAVMSIATSAGELGLVNGEQLAPYTEMIFGQLEEMPIEKALNLASNFQKAAAGDLHASSKVARDLNIPSMNYYDESGAPIYTSDWQAFEGFIQGHRGTKALEDYLMANFKSPRSGGPRGTRKPTSVTGLITERLQEIGDTEMISALGSGGMTEAYALQRDRDWNYMLQGQQYRRDIRTENIQHDREMFGYQWAQLGAQYTSQMHQFEYSEWQMDRSYYYQQEQSKLAKQRMYAGFAHAEFSEGIQWQRMNLGNEYSVQQEAIQRERMDINRAMQQSSLERQEKRLGMGQEWQMFTLGFSHETDLLQRGFERQSWAYQDEMRELNYQWNIEDISEDIRFSHGRQRRQLIKKKERLELSHENEEEYIDQTRENQEELWERSDEFYQAQKEHILELQEMEIEEFEEQKENRDALWELEDRQFNLQVSHRETMYDLSVEEFDENKRNREELQRLSIQEFNLTQQQRDEFYEKEKDHLAQQIIDYQTSYGIQASIIAENERHYEEVLKLEEDWQKIQDQHEIDTAAFNDTIGNTKSIFESIASTVQSMSNVDANANLSLLSDLVWTIKEIDPFLLKELNELFVEVGH